MQHSGIALKYIHSNIERLLVIAQKHQGYAFGRYVRDVVSKVIANDFSETYVSTVDIWFKDDGSYNSFIKEALSTVPTGKVESRATSFSVPAYFFGLGDNYGDNVAQIKCHILPSFPSFDFNVNCLYYDPSTRMIRSFDGNTTELLTDARNKMATMTTHLHLGVTSDGGNHVTIDGKEYPIQRYGARLILKRMYEQGWTVYDPDGRKVTIKNPTEKGRAFELVVTK